MPGQAGWLPRQERDDGRRIEGVGADGSTHHGPASELVQRKCWEARSRPRAKPFIERSSGFGQPPSLLEPVRHAHLAVHR
jgi:hypothetical protein